MITVCYGGFVNIVFLSLLLRVVLNVSWTMLWVKTDICIDFYAPVGSNAKIHMMFSSSAGGFSRGIRPINTDRVFRETHCGWSHLHLHNKTYHQIPDMVPSKVCLGSITFTGIH